MGRVYQAQLQCWPNNYRLKTNIPISHVPKLSNRSFYPNALMVMGLYRPSPKSAEACVTIRLPTLPPTQCTRLGRQYKVLAVRQPEKIDPLK